MQIFFLKSFAQKMCCSWRSHRAESGQLSPSPASLLLPKPPSSERGPGRRPRNRSQKELSSGDLHQGKSRSRGKGGGNVGKSRESLPRMQAVPMGVLPAVQAELRAGLEGRSQPQGGSKGKEGIPILSATRALLSCQPQHTTTMAQAAGTMKHQGVGCRFAALGTCHP